MRIGKKQGGGVTLVANWIRRTAPSGVTVSTSAPKKSLDAKVFLWYLGYAFVALVSPLDV